MRPIKFRAWDTAKNRMWWNVQNAYDTLGDHQYPDKENDRDFGDNLQPTSFGEVLDDESLVVMQYTGLKDKDGTPIYEGDIVKLDQTNPPNYKVEFIEGAFCLAYIGGDLDGHYALDMHYIQHADNKTSTVIGNIYENPELLETKQH